MPSAATNERGGHIYERSTRSYVCVLRILLGGKDRARTLSTRISASVVRYETAAGIIIIITSSIPPLAFLLPPSSSPSPTEQQLLATSACLPLSFSINIPPPPVVQQISVRPKEAAVTKGREKEREREWEGGRGRVGGRGATTYVRNTL